jgi:peptidoglycan/xylan/chitin deacetylase (PgdA/CDA1 family)
VTSSDERQGRAFFRIVSRGFAGGFAGLLRTCLLAYAFFLLGPDVWASGNDQFRIPIFVYHRFGATGADSMTITVALFEAHLKYLRDNDYQVIPLRQLVEHRLNGGPELPARAVVITADDGHRSVYTHMLPLVRLYRLPVTLFIYPSAISNADYAMTWEQLSELKQTSLFDIQSHSFWHPNFKDEKRRLKHDEYEKFVRTQLVKSKETLEKKLQTHVDMLAWPFGIFDDELIGKASEAGYKAAFTIEGHHATPGDSIMALPRYLVTQAFQMKVFAEIMGGKPVKVEKGY